MPVAVEVLPEQAGDGPDAVVSLLKNALRDGGCALVVRNTVGRAQDTYRAVKEAFADGEVELLHARLPVGERADRSARILDLLGPPDKQAGRARPRRLVVVATQLAEQSFDIDVDVLITDVAPIDLLLQRAGRLHRHVRRAGERPAAVSTPRVVVTGMNPRIGGPPTIVAGSCRVYGEYVLLRSAELVIVAAAGEGWHIPRDVPDLVRRGYAEPVEAPDGWSEAVDAARMQWQMNQHKRGEVAANFLLAGEDALGVRDLAGLHDRVTAKVDDDNAVAAVVRDGPETVEVILVRRDERGFRTLDGRALGALGAALFDTDLVEAVVNTAVRLPAYPAVTAAAKADLRPLPECGNDPWLRRALALILDEDLSTVLGEHRIRYDQELGLVVTSMSAQAVKPRSGGDNHAS